MKIKDFLRNTYCGKRYLSSRVKAHASQHCDDYANKFLENAASLCRRKNVNLRLRIIVESHVVEKGLSHNKLKYKFGINNIQLLRSHLDEYISGGGEDSWIIDHASKLLAEYDRVNECLVREDFQSLNLPYSSDDEHFTGVKWYDVQQVKDNCRNMGFSEFARSRASVRPYDVKCKPVDKDVLSACVKLAQTAPNACNRQATRVHILTDMNVFEKIEKIQLGCRGFGTNVSAFIFITSDLNLYDIAEDRLPMFDAGLFSMNLVYALQYYGLFSCMLNATFPGHEEEIVNMLHLPENEVLCGLIAVCDLDNVGVKVPASDRRNTKQILHFVE